MAELLIKFRFFINKCINIEYNLNFNIRLSKFRDMESKRVIATN